LTPEGIRQRSATRALVAAVFLVSAALRLVAVDRPLNIDEALWIRRGGAFVSALLEGVPAATYTRPHPGVTTMWLVGLSDVAWCRIGVAREGSWRACAQRLADDPLPALDAYVVPRCVQALLTAAALALFAALSSRLLGLRAAVLAAALLVFEPFFLGYQRFITTDALQSDLAAVAAVLFLLYLRQGGWSPLLASGAALGLAVATKVPAVLIAVPLVASAAAVELGGWPTLARRGFQRRGLELAAWAAMAAAVVIIIWPALWVRPLGTLRQLLLHLRLETRANEIRLDDPGWTFYARVLAWRFSPLLHLGALLSAVALSWPAWRRRQAQRVELEVLAGLVLITLVLLRLAGEAGVDRYLLPVVPPLALFAGAGWARTADWIAARSGRGGLAAILTFAVAGGQAALLAPHLPEGITFYNPLLGGPIAASRALAIGQGEGLERAAWRMNAEPGSESMVAAAGFASAFAPYFRGHTIEIPWASVNQAWLEADRVVLYIRQAQIGSPDPLVVAYLWSQTPLYSVRLHGLDYARVYRGPIVLPPELRAASTGMRVAPRPPALAAARAGTRSAPRPPVGRPPAPGCRRRGRLPPGALLPA
jgi:4-amino-4-deoxy-L-arabinose transferase-like glycosyltransferase